MAGAAAAWWKSLPQWPAAQLGAGGGGPETAAGRDGNRDSWCGGPRIE
jgi:hypothetical protein